MLNSLYKIRKLSMLGGLAGAAVVLTGCVVTPYYPAQTRVVTVQPSVAVTADSGANSAEYVQTAPPAAYNEVVTVSPGVGYIWAPGLWYWSGGRHVWRAGVWQRPPYGYRTWNNGGWTHVPGRGWQHNRGYWR